MNESFDREMERQTRRLTPAIFKPPTVKSLADIKRLVAELDPARTTAQSVPIATELVSSTEHGVRENFKVVTQTMSQNKRAILLHGFGILKSHDDARRKLDENIKPVVVNGKEMLPARCSGDGVMWVDPLLTRWLSAYRDGLFICWKIDDVIYKYNIFEHKLFRSK